MSTPAPALTCAQEEIWLAHHWGEDPSLYNIAQILEIEGPLQLPRFLRAVHLCLLASDTFHYAFGQDETQKPRLIALAPDRLQEATFREVDARGWEESAVQELLRKDLRRPFCLQQDLLFRCIILRRGELRYDCYIKSHHVALDGMGFSLWNARLWETYQALAEDSNYPGPSIPSIAAAQASAARYAESARRNQDARYWRHALRLRRAVRYASGPQALVDHPTLLRLSWPEKLLKQLQTLASDSKLPLSALIAGGFIQSIAARKQWDDLSLGLPFANRMGSPAAGIPCMWMNLLAMSLKIPRGASLLQLAELYQRQLKAMAPHSRYRHEWLRRDMRARQGHAELFGPVFNSISRPRSNAPAPLRVYERRLSGGPVQDLTLTLIQEPSAQRAELELELPQGRGSPALQSWAHTLLEGLQHASDSSTRVAVPPPEPACPLLTTLEGNFRRLADKTAIEAAGQKLSYTQLAQACHALQERLAQHPGPIAIWMERSVQAIVTMLAALMAKRAYAPLDPEGPLARNVETLQALDPGLLVHGQGLPREIEALSIPSLDLRSPKPVPRAHPRIHNEEIAYWMHTSGSTGKARAVAISREALSNFIHAAAQRYAWTQKDRVLHFAPLAFDASVEEIFLSLFVGATLVVRKAQDSHSIAHFVEAIRRHQITVVDLPTAFWHEWAFALTSPELVPPPALRQVILGGEAVQRERLQQWQAGVSPQLQLINSYGPTETTVVVSASDLQAFPSHTRQEIPIGGPLAGLQIDLRNQEGAAIGPGEAGEIFIRGGTVALGYADCPQANRERFAPHPTTGQPCYRSGDKARLDGQGELLFLGRVDDELKISGFRIHPKEVECAILAYPNIKQAVVCVVRQASASSYLVAHLECEAEAFDEERLREHLACRLIGAALPRQILRHDRFALNRSGKIDRRALQQQSEALSEALPAAAPLQGLAKELAELWQALLHQPVRSLQADFFELGGESLHCLQLSTRLSQRLNRPVDANLFVQHSRLGDLCRALEENSAPGAELDLKAQMLQDRESLRLAPRRVSRPGPGPLLLTGATGFIGRAILKHLAAQQEQEILCLTRRAPRDPQAFGAKVKWIVGDLGKNALGLSESELEALSGRVRAIVHCAGSVSLMHDYAYCKKVNVQAGRSLLDLLASGSPKKILAFSTLAVAPGPKACSEIYEDPLPWHHGLHNGYTQSKWVAEEGFSLAHQAGYWSTSLRIGRAYAAPPNQPNSRDLLTRVQKASHRHGLWPDLDIRESWISTAEICAMVQHFLQDSQRWPQLVHGSDGQNYRWQELFDQACKGSSGRLCPFSHWQSHMQREGNLEDQAVAALLAPLVGLEPDPYFGLAPAPSRFFEGRFRFSDPNSRYAQMAST